MRNEMSFLSRVAKTGLAAATALVVLSATSTASASEAGNVRRTPCFFASNWGGWSSPSPDVIYLEVGRKVYKVDVVGGVSHMKSAGTYLVNQLRGSGSICSHLDLDLAVADTNGFSVPVIARKLTLLTPEEVALIPRKDRP